MPSGGNFSSCNCGPDAAACESPTQPVATVGLCLADGTPIAVTVVRDCAGTVTSEGWIDLTSGTWNAGSPPAGTIACGDSRSIQVSGTFCDVDPMGGVLGLVLIEYSYAADGSIAAVRLVDAVTGETYTPLGEVTTCPAGVDAPERDLVQLCDTAEDGTVTSFVRDYQRDSVGQITGHADYDLGGAPYTPTGTVDVCQDCPTSYASECWQQVAAQVSYDNTAGGPCGSISPGSMPQCAGTWVMTSWIIDGVERVPSPVTFTANGCGGNPGQFHADWAATLAPFDPTSSWEAAYNETCLWYIRTTGVDPNKVYGDMVMYRTVAADQVFTLGPSSSRSDATFTKVLRQECDGSTSATWLDEDGQELAEPPTGDLTPCDGAQTEECASSVTVLRLCDLDPDVPPNSDGKRCAKPFLRHLVYDCSGALTETRDTTPDGVTPYTPVQVVDCGSGGLPAMVEVPWEVVNIEPDPASPAGRGLVFTLSPIDDPSIVGTVTVTTSSSYGTSSCPAEPPQYAYRNPTTYTFTPDQALRDAATYVRCDLIDFDTFEPITGLSPLPDRFGGTAYLDGTTVRPTGNDGTGEMYYDGPPATWTYRVGNTGGGNSCSMLSFAAVSLRAEGCCSDCGGSGGGDGSGRTVQEVCVIANAAPQDVMRWTRVIENDGATIYYLDESGARYDSTLPAGHQIVVCPAEEPEPCRESDTVLLCDLPAGDGSGEPTATDVSAAPYPWDADQIRCVNEHPGGGGALWTGGSVTIPARVSGALSCTPNQYLAGVAATLQADRPACDDGTVDITVSLTARNDGPSAAAANYAGSLRLHRTDTGERLTDTGNVLTRGARPAGGSGRPRRDRWSRASRRTS
ncbi:hypothetical protein, partial [Streptomyces althioticus]|uniref:hypothetical protein n=1 Tax=Streptomyces althioticus TaxID=83380 RepID=UPI003F559CF1